MIVSVCLSCQKYSGKALLRVRIHERLVEALAMALLLARDEYQRALQSKHWEQVSCLSVSLSVCLSYLI